MNLIKTSILSAIETAIKLASGFVVIKYIALTVGPEGVAFFGQFQSFFAAIVILISGGFTTGLVCLSAQEKPDENTNQHYLANALGLGLCSALLTGIFLSVFATQLSMMTLNTVAFKNSFYLLAISSVLIVVYQVIIAVLNGWGLITRLITCKSICSILLLFFSLLLVKSYGLSGGLAALISMQAIAALFAIWVISRIKSFNWRWLKPKFNLKTYKEFFHYWLMSLVTLISTPLILMLVRIHIASISNWDTVGIWEASWKISELYLIVITTALTTYYIPKLSQAIDKHEELNIVIKVIALGATTAIILAISVYFFRALIVEILFSNKFTEVTNIIALQLVGSVIKIPAWVFSYHMIVKKRTVLFLFTELLFGTSFYILARILFDQYGLIGLSYAYSINYALYFFYCATYFWNDNLRGDNISGIQEVSI